MRHSSLRYVSMVGVAVLCLLWSGVAFANVPMQIPIQTYLTESDGTPIDGSAELTVKLFPAKTGSSAVFSEKFVPQVEVGVASVTLGDKQELTMSILEENPTLYVELVVNGEALSPRKQLLAVPFAFEAKKAENAKKLAGKEPSSFLTKNYAPSWPDVENVAAGGPLSVGQDNKLGFKQCSADQVLKWGSGSSGSSGWTCAADATGPTYSAASPMTVSGSNTIQLAACDDQEVLKYVASSGQWRCKADKDTTSTVTAGAGLTASSGTIDIQMDEANAGESGLSASSSGLTVKSCNNAGESLQWDGSKWSCSPNKLSVGNGLTGSSGTVSVKLDEANQGDSGLTISSSGAKLKDCSSSGQGLIWDSQNSKWACGTVGGLTGGQMISISNSKINLDSSNCSDGGTPIWDNDNSQWTCSSGLSAGTGIAINSGAITFDACGANSHWVYDGSQWTCSSRAGKGLKTSGSNKTDLAVQLDESNAGDSGLATGDSGIKFKDCNGPGQVLSWNGSAWTCGSNMAGAGDGLASSNQKLAIQLDESSQGNSGLSISSSGLTMKTSCSADNYLKWDGSKWTCTPELSAGGMISINSSTGEISVDSSNCTGGDSPEWDAGSGQWTCVETDTKVGADEGLKLESGNMSLGDCGENELWIFDGTFWTCSSRAGNGLETVGQTNMALNLKSNAQGLDLDSTGLSLTKGCTTGDALEWDGSKWACQPNDTEDFQTTNELTIDTGTNPDTIQFKAGGTNDADSASTWIWDEDNQTWKIGTLDGKGLTRTTNGSGLDTMELDIGSGLTFNSGKVEVSNVPEESIDHSTCSASDFKAIVNAACPFGSSASDNNTTLPSCDKVGLGATCIATSDTSSDSALDDSNNAVCGLAVNKNNCGDGMNGDKNLDVYIKYQ